MAPVPPVVWEVTRRWGDEILSVDYLCTLPPALHDAFTPTLQEDGTEIQVRPAEIPERIGLGFRVDAWVVACMAVSIAIHAAFAAWVFLVPPAAVAIGG